VVVEEGQVKRRSISRLSQTELEQGYALVNMAVQMAKIKAAKEQS